MVSKPLATKLHYRRNCYSITRDVLVARAHTSIAIITIISNACSEGVCMLSVCVCTSLLYATPMGSVVQANGSVGMRDTSAMRPF